MSINPMNKGVYEYKKEWSCLSPCPPLIFYNHTIYF